ncbi:putative arsenite-resistance protein 2 [Fasciolopsis buskii]|uniref:Putative arsenite-resistance protein 2 n=1 Tax=Fasciolopsis buskii TaxID=27845 RepID=A0A8E0RS31_9TREM|nr:putative arsenite-resistance protein 2 [Fasciolopsis buski]
MADSDDESDRHRSRDKFRRERSDHDNRRRPGDKREPFDDKAGVVGGYGRTDHRSLGDVRGAGTDRGRSPVQEPVYKRARKDFGDEYKSIAPKRREARLPMSSEEEGMYRPPLVPFKRFLEPLDDLITEEDACTKYREYKETYAKRHIEEFFEAHKSEEWLRQRYHPDYMPKRKEALLANLRHRLSVFMRLYDKGFFENQSVQMDNSENLIKLMDAVVIKLEGGTDEDLKVLDSTERNRYFDEEESHRIPDTVAQKSDPVDTGHRSEEGEADSDVDGDDSDKEAAASPRTGRDFNPSDSSDKPNGWLRKASEDSSHSKHSPKQTGGSPDATLADNDGSENHDSRDQTTTVHKDDSDAVDDDEDVPTPTTAEAPDGTVSTQGGVSPSVSSVLLGSSSEAKSRPAASPADNTSGKDECRLPAQQSDANDSKRTWPLHKTTSIFFRALPANVTESELRELCASQPGFLRLALWEPVPERRFTRHAWATYNPTVNIKKICWALNTSPLLREKFTLPNGELGATVNRELAQRVRPLTPLTRHKPIMRKDLMLVTQLIARLDDENNLWDTEESTVESSGAPAAESKNPLQSTLLSLAVRSRNPLLKNITDFLVEEGGSEEEALLESGQIENEGNSENQNTSRQSVVLESDPSLAKVLDQLILYLRVVHSVDYYAGAIYPMEDLMPHRCGILHARGDRGLNPTIPGGRTPTLVFSQREIDDHLRNFELKLRSLIDIPPPLTDEMMVKLGMRDPEKVAEEFIEANIQKRTGKKKPFKVVWVCPLSDKKFREPIFVRKHIFNKHMEKVEAAKKDNAVFFNNYLRDPRRPSLPEAPYHIAQQFYSSGSAGGSYRGPRGAGRMTGTGGGGSGGGSYRGNYRGANAANTTSLLSAAGSVYSRGAGSFQVNSLLCMQIFIDY